MKKQFRKFLISISCFVVILLFCSCFILNTALAAPDLAIPDSLVKGSSSAIYYYAENGNRYVFPNNKTYETWFSDFSSVQTISNKELSLMPLVGNITYRPGVKLVKIQTDPKVYAVGRGGILRWVKGEELAIQLYGEDWNKKIDDVPDTFFINYKIGNPIENLSDYSPAVETLGTRTINIDKEIKTSDSPLRSDTLTLAPIAITIVDIAPDEILNSVASDLTIMGAKFLLGARVFLNGIEIDGVIFINEFTLKINIPASFNPEIYSVKVLNPNGTISTLQNALTITAVIVERLEDSFSLDEIFNKVAPAVVQIQVDEGAGCPCTGSGMIIDRLGYVLTNYHVIEGDEDVEVKLYDDTIVQGEVLGWNELRDLALIKIPENENFVELGDYKNVFQGDVAYTLGFPLGVPVTNISEGIILAKNQIIKGSIYLLTNAEIKHGSSGGPLVDGKGEVIGVVRGGLVIPGTETFYGYNFAIPVDIVGFLLSDLKAGVRT